MAISLLSLGLSQSVHGITSSLRSAQQEGLLQRAVRFQRRRRQGKRRHKQNDGGADDTEKDTIHDR